MKLQLFGSTISHGQTYRGVSRAAAELRMSGLLPLLEGYGWRVQDFGDGPPDYLGFYRQIFEEMDEDAFQLIVGGDHSHSLATIPAILNQRPNAGVIWIDAHGDINTPSTSLTGQLHGMPLAGLLGLFTNRECVENRVGLGDALPLDLKKLRPEDLVLIGVRDLDPAEEEIIDRLKIRTYSRDQVRDLGASAVAHMALAHLRSCESLHVSFDIDAVDPELAPTTGVPVEDGLLMRDIVGLMQTLGRSGKVRSLELTEINPELAASVWDWDLTVEIVKTALAAFFRPQARLDFENLRPSLRALGLQFIEKAFS